MVVAPVSANFTGTVSPTERWSALAVLVSTSRSPAESARVLKAGGVYLYDTINRTPQSKLILIKLFQEWGWTSFMPPRLHDWEMFIRPGELARLLEQQGLRPGPVRGLKPRANPVTILRALRARKLGRLTYREAAERIDLGESPDPSVLYLGYAQKAASSGDPSNRVTG